MINLTDKVAIVTGGASGLGKEISIILAAQGAKVIVADIVQDKAADVASDIKKSGNKAEEILLDIRDEEQIDSTLSNIKQKYGRIDFVINNAGTDVTKPVDKLTVEEIDRVLNINLRGTYLMSKFALQIMYTQKSGHIVNIASTASKRAWIDASAYHASKWGIIGLSRGLYVEARERNVRVSVVVPGGMKTPFLLERFPDIDKSKLQDAKNVADVVRFVISQPEETIIPEVMVLPLHETSWP